MEKSKNKLQQVKDILNGHKTMLIIMQDNPDPDAIAAAVALRKLANGLCNVQCSIAHGGTVGRAENRALVKYLTLNLRHFDDIDLTQYDLFAMVDTQPRTGNNSLPNNIEPEIVIDHHPCRDLTRHSRFTDVRSKYGATASIMHEYLQHAKIEIDVPLATALVYAIQSDTQDFGRDCSKADIDAFVKLYPIANKRMLSQIQRGKVERDYYKALSTALQNARVYDNAIVSDLGDIEHPDIIAEVADLLLRDDLTDWVMCYGISQNKIVISLRSYRAGSHTGESIKAIVGENGTGGGHPSYAGGQIPIEDIPKKEIEKIKKSIVERYIQEASAEKKASKPLIT